MGKREQRNFSSLLKKSKLAENFEVVSYVQLGAKTIHRRDRRVFRRRMMYASDLGLRSSMRSTRPGSELCHLASSRFKRNQLSPPTPLTCSMYFS